MPQPLSRGLLQMNSYRLRQLSAGLSPREWMTLNVEEWFHMYHNCRKKAKGRKAVTFKDKYRGTEP